jgi:hypothetical protein
MSTEVSARVLAAIPTSSFELIAISSSLRHALAKTSHTATIPKVITERAMNNTLPQRNVQEQLTYDMRSCPVLARYIEADM